MIERPRPQSKVSLEDLLRLKRAERPSSEFWVEFEGQLRHKQLAAIVDRRPWWRRLSISSLRRLSVPLGATAVIALTLTTLREQSARVPVSSGQVAAAPTSSPAETLASAAVVNPASSSIALASLPASSLEPVRALEVAEIIESPAISTSAVAAAPSQLTGNEERPSDSALSLAQVVLGFADKPQVENESNFETGSLASATIASSELKSLSADGVGGVVNSAVEVSQSRQLHGGRLLASLDSSFGDQAVSESRVARARERITSRLTEQSLYDSISRLGLNADRVSIKF